MENKWQMREEILSDGSKAYRLERYDGEHQLYLIIEAENEVHALAVLDTLNTLPPIQIDPIMGGV